MFPRLMAVLVVVLLIVGINNLRQRGSVFDMPTNPQAQVGELDGISIEEPASPASIWQPAVRVYSGGTVTWKDPSGTERTFTVSGEGQSASISPGNWSLEWVGELRSFVAYLDGQQAFYVIPLGEGQFSIGRADQGSTFRK